MNEPPKDSPDLLTLVSYLIAAAIMIPIGWWLKESHAGDIGHWILSLGGLLY